jgi:nitrate reductase NapE protein
MEFAGPGNKRRHRQLQMGGWKQPPKPIKKVRGGGMAERSYRVKLNQEANSTTSGDISAEPASKRREIMMFLLLAVVIWPFITVAVVGGYGFLVWMTQLIVGPPGPPPV